MFDRGDNPGYTEYGENANRITNIAAVFPLFFLLVAALVCSSAVSRMVEEQRGQVGIFKALGYGNGTVMFKYLLYGVTAALLGSITGLLVFMKLFPYVIMWAYGVMYNIPGAVIPYEPLLAISAVAASVGIIALVVFLTVRRELREQPAALMRPKAPRAGKRVLLERLPFIWRRMGFSAKVSVRNLFRYKKRMLMTVIGIAGCTALTLTGFGLRDSVNDIAKLQFQKISLYDGYSLLAEDLTQSQRERVDAIFRRIRLRHPVRLREDVSLRERRA